jgi:hypothetical protein
MSVRELVPRFLALGEGYAGRGPDHPDTANPALGAVAEALLAKHPVLLRDPSYVEFLRTYAGASVSVYDPDGDELWFAFLIGLDGFGGKVVPFTEEGYGVDADGFLCVAQLYHQRSRVELDFGYYVAGAGEAGIHRIAERDGRSAQGWYCESFVEWLGRFVRAGEAIFSE